MSENYCNGVPFVSGMGSTQGYNLNSYLVHLVMCAMGLLIGSAIKLFGS